jgi:hypothetical protein
MMAPPLPGEAMDDTTNCEKLAIVLNRAGDQGKGSFCKMLWGNQPDTVQAQLKPLLSANTLELLSQPDLGQDWGRASI